MLFLRGEKSVLQTVNLLTRPYQDGQHSFQSLKIAYQKMLSEVQQEIPHSNKLSTEYISDIKKIRQLINVFSTESLADDTFYDMELSRKTSSNKILNRTESSVLALSEKYPPFSWIFNLVMDSIFNVSSKIASGGTTSAAVGILFVDPRDHYTEEDMYELLVHELGHTLLFLHEWAYGLFNDIRRLTNPETFALSAIRNQLRPFDKAIHSVLVAVEVLLLRKRVLGNTKKRFLHPQTDMLITMVRDSINSISFTDQKQDMLTNYGKKLLADCEIVINNYNMEDVENVFVSWSK